MFTLLTPEQRFILGTSSFRISYIIASAVSKINNEANNYTQQKKLRKSQKTMQHKNTKSNNDSIFIYLFRYMSSVEKNVYFSSLAPIPLLWYSVK